MTPIERVSIKSQALAVLGLKNSTATDHEIKSAYRARVKEKHPDRCDGASDEFMRITSAFEYLSGEVDEFDPEPRQAPISRTPRPTMNFTQKPRTRSKTMSRPVSKPSLQATQVKFSQEILAACKALLCDDDGLLATHQRRVGRSVAYKVPVKLLRNVNKVALPTGDLTDNRRMQPCVLEINATEIRDGAYRVPSDVLAEQFPGARSVEILFVADI